MLNHLLNDLIEDINQMQASRAVYKLLVFARQRASTDWELRQAMLAVERDGADQKSVTLRLSTGEQRTDIRRICSENLS